MSKALEIINEFREYWRNKLPISVNGANRRLDLIEKELKDYEELKERIGFDPTVFKQDFETLMKEHKALEIIRNKVVLIDVFLESEDVNDYNEFYANSKDRHLTQEEYDLLKEVLLCQ